MKKNICLLFLCLLIPTVLLADEYDDIVASALETSKSDTVKAKDQLDVLIKKNPNRGSAYIAKGIIFFQFDNDLGKASVNFKKGVDLTKDSEERSSLIKFINEQTSITQSQEEAALLRAAYDSTENGEPQKSISSLEKAFSLNKKNWRTYYEMGYALIDADRVDEAAAYFEAGLKINPLSQPMMVELIYVYSHLGDVEKTRKVITEKVKYFGDSPGLRHELAYAYNKNKQRKDAVKILAENIKLFPTYANSYYAIGQIYYEDKDYENARIHLARFIELAHDDKDAEIVRCVEDAKKILDEISSDE
jgi:tetratricopeptide (TPR) repeat protein